MLHVQSLPYRAFTALCPLVVTVHSPVLEELRYYKGINGAKVPVAYTFERLTLLNAEVVITVSRATSDQLERMYGVERRKLRLIPNGVGCVRFSPKLKSWVET